MSKRRIPAATGPGTSRQSQPRARRLAADGAPASRRCRDHEYACAILNREGFANTLEPPLLGGQCGGSILFESRIRILRTLRVQLCLLLMRRGGHTARVVTAIREAHSNELAANPLCAQSDAHAWAEIWLKTAAGLRIDPTAAISPSRVQSGLSRRLPQCSTAFWRAHNRHLLLSCASTRCHDQPVEQWVLGYNRNASLPLTASA